jgi:hypothetical protein
MSSFSRFYEVCLEREGAGRLETRLGMRLEMRLEIVSKTLSIASLIGQIRCVYSCISTEPPGHEGVDEDTEVNQNQTRICRHERFPPFLKAASRAAPDGARSRYEKNS